jgi:hypothetical protein
MVAVVVVVVAVTALIQVCAKADGATRKTNRRGADTTRTRINLHMGPNTETIHDQKSEGEALHPFR